MTNREPADERGDAPDLRIRQAVRALVIDPEQRVLLVRWDFPDRPKLGYPSMSVWGTPGGGIETGEGIEPALRRELAEELGLEGVELGPQIWYRTHVIPFLNGRWDGQREQYFLVETAAFDPVPQLSAERLRAEHLMAVRWWTRDELASFVPTPTETFAPRRLPQLVAELLADGVPAAPIDVGV